jgi:hypothetical protein
MQSLWHALLLSGFAFGPLHSSTVLAVIGALLAFYYKHSGRRSCVLAGGEFRSAIAAGETRCHFAGGFAASIEITCAGRYKKR